MKKRLSKKDRESEREEGTCISVRQCESQKHKCIQLGLRAFLDKREFRNNFVDEKKDKQERERERKGHTFQFDSVRVKNINVFNLVCKCFIKAK